MLTMRVASCLWSAKLALCTECAFESYVFVWYVRGIKLNAKDEPENTKFRKINQIRMKCSFSVYRRVL